MAFSPRLLSVAFQFNIILSEQLRPDSQLCSECIAQDQQRESTKETQDS
jgi:hypothetical protein